MGQCDLCGQDAGFLRKRHKECEARQTGGWASILEAVAQTALGRRDAVSLATSIDEVAGESYLQDYDLSSAYPLGWARAVQIALEDDILSADEELSLTDFASAHSLGQDDLDDDGAYTAFIKGITLREVLEGRLPHRAVFPPDLPFNLQQNETIVWVWPNTTYHEQRTRTHYEGGSRGVSVRVAKGVYLRSSGFRGYPVETTAAEEVGTGLLAATTKHLYFACEAKSFRMRYDKIVSFTPFEDGIGVQRDAQTAKPQTFTTGEGWFTYNLIANLARGIV